MQRRRKEKYIYAVGRRKEASVTLRLYKGKKESLVNNKMVFDYFPGEINRVEILRPLVLTGLENKYYFVAKAKGGGKKAQKEALVLALSRSIVKIDSQKFKKILKKEGFLTRDARIRERRKVGTGGKARREKQSPKR